MKKLIPAVVAAAASLARAVILGSVAVMSAGSVAWSADQVATDCEGKDPDVVVAACTKFIARGTRESNQHQALAHLLRGIAYDHKGDYDRAIADADSAIALKPDYPDAYNNRAVAYRQKGDFDRAIADEDKAIALNPRMAEAYDNRSFDYYNKRDYDRAIADATSAIALKPNYVEAYGIRGTAYFQKGDDDRAIGDYDKLIEINPSYADAYNARGYSYYRKADYDRAIADASKAIALKPNYAEAYDTRGAAYNQKGDSDRAMADLDRAIEINPTYALAYVHRGEAYARKRDYQRAVADYDQAVAQKPNSAEEERDRARALADRDAAKASLAASVVADKPAAVAAAADTPVAARAETRIALVIGNSNYAAVAKLPNPPRDAAAVAAALRADGFSDVKLIADVTRQDLVRALNDFQDRAGTADWAVIYFAGHGLELDGTNYLVPVDAALKTDRDVQDEAVSLDRVLASVANARKLRLVILDACRNNPFATDMRMTTATRSVHRGLARIEPSGGTLVAYAAKDGEEAIDGDAANSPFAAALVKYLATPGLEVGRLLRLVRDDVLAATDRQQEPFVYGSLPGEELFFRPQ